MKLKAFCCALASILSTGALAQTYVVGVENLPFAPHYSVDAQGNYQGFARDVLDLFAASSGITLEYRPLSVDALLPALLSGQVDLKYPDDPGWSPERKAGKSLRYSQPVTQYVDGVLVAPDRLGQGTGSLKRLALVEGWTPRGCERLLQGGQVSVAPSSDLRQMIHTALKKQADGAYFNVVVATYYLDNIRARPGALVFDPSLPHTRGAFHLSTIKHGELIERFDRFLAENAREVAALKAKYGVEENLDSEHLGVEQWKVDFLERQKAKQKSP